MVHIQCTTTIVIIFTINKMYYGIQTAQNSSNLFRLSRVLQDGLDGTRVHAEIIGSTKHADTQLRVANFYQLHVKYIDNVKHVDTWSLDGGRLHLKLSVTVTATKSSAVADRPCEASYN